MDNRFLVKLLTIQQDGSGAISAPSNWKHRPLLEVETNLALIIDDLFDSVFGQEGVGRWHFFVGSPGNGKSAAVGKLARRLLDNGCSISTEDRIDIEELEEKQIPYVLQVREPDAKFSFAWLAQDASVLKNPFARDMDPPKQLIQLLEDASLRGISLVLCTNRGVIENAYRRVYLDPEMNRRSWFKALGSAIEDEELPVLDYDGDNRRRVFDRFQVTHTQLDNHSLLINDETFVKLLENATHEGNWQACNDCTARVFCPFKANRDWVSNEIGRQGILKVLQRAEILSSQIMAFREALALISFILAGCPRDYIEMTPCEWVRNRLEQKDFFSLISRRIYMSLFSSFSPHGLEHDTQIGENQRKYLKLLLSGIEEDAEEVNALGKVLSQENTVSTDVGVSRLLGVNGVLKKLDPLVSPLPRDFLERWTGDLDHETGLEQALISPVEEKCYELWNSLEERVELTSEDPVEKYRWLRRWKSAFTIRVGALLEGYTSFGEELDELLEIIAYRGGRSLTGTDLERLMSFEGELRKLLNPLAEEGIDLSDFVSLSGSWTSENLKPRVVNNPRSKALGLIISFGGKEEVLISAETFIWLKRKAEHNMSEKSFPSKLLEAARDEQVRAASKSKYSYENDNVTLIIRRPEANEENIKLTRYMGEVVIQ